MLIIEKLETTENQKRNVKYYQILTSTESLLTSWFIAFQNLLFLCICICNTFLCIIIRFSHCFL